MGALGAEYDNARLLMGAQRPGLNGVEDQDQMFSYAKLFVKGTATGSAASALNATAEIWPTWCMRHG